MSFYISCADEIDKKSFMVMYIRFDINPTIKPGNCTSHRSHELLLEGEAVHEQRSDPHQLAPQKPRLAFWLHIPVTTKNFYSSEYVSNGTVADHIHSIKANLTMFTSMLV